jgi:16S rRNA (cytosine967-C5)-methyltransferase
MLPSARIEAVIELTENVSATLRDNGASADVIVRNFFNARRYAGSKDRRYVTEKLYEIIRRWEFLTDITKSDPRKMVMAHLQLSDDDPKAYFNGEPHSPAALTDEEILFLKNVKPEQLEHHRLNYPLWLEDRLKDRFGDKFNQEMTALNQRAPLTLRIVRKTKEIEAFLLEKEIGYNRGVYANSAIILNEKIQIRDWPIYKNGLVEIQDEAAQLAVKYVELAPGQQVMDLCAGAGGKTLAAAGYMKNKGQIYAFDISENRLKDLKTRAKRSKVHIVQPRVLSVRNRAKILEEFKGKMDRVILDVPCSGTGTWRRNPEARFRLSEESLSQYVKTQSELLEEAWQIVKAGGRVAYMTCSILKSENEQQIEQFLSSHSDATLIPIRKQGIEALEGTLLVSPFSRQMDGFFVAILEKDKVQKSPELQELQE